MRARQLKAKIDRSDTIALIVLIPLCHPLTRYHPPIGDGKLTDARKVERSQRRKEERK